MEASGHSRRSRGLGVVTPNACVECRKKRTKCDGQSQCGRCVSKEIECIYEIPTRHSKEALREEIDQLRRRQEQNERIFAALASDNEAEIVLEQLRNHETPENILKRLDEAKAKSPTREDSEMMSVSEGDRTLTAYSHQSGQQATGSALGESTIQWARGQGMEHILGPEFGVEAPSKNRPSGNVTWTEVTSDEELVEHLITLYFCWEYPTFASLSKEHFLEDFREGRQSYCSPILVNSMLAVGCRFSTLPSARADPNDSKTAGDHFFAEALRILDQESNHHKLTTIQALGLMSIREASCGRTSESIYYAGQSVRIAIEMGLHLEGGSEGDGGASSEQSVKAATFWGAFSLDQAWSIGIGRLPQFSKETILMPKPAIVEDIEKRSWVPYADNGVPLERDFIQPSNVHSVYKAFCELSEIVHKSLYVLYTPGNHCTSKSLVGVYTIYLHWYDGIPEVLRLGQNSTPSVLFVHMYYHYVILLLFRPFTRLRIVGSSFLPRDICRQAADALSALASSYSKLYTLQRTPSFVPYIVLTSSITHLEILGTAHGDPEKVRRGFSDLKSMEDCHNFARRGRDILIFLADHWQINISLADGSSHSALQMKRNPKNLVRPRSSSLNLFAPTVQSVDTTTRNRSVVDEHRNFLFCPFPLQGRPLLGAGEILEKAGFNILKR